MTDLQDCRVAALKDGREVLIRPARAEDAAAVLDYLRLVGGESPNISFGAEGIGLTEEQEASEIGSLLPPRP